MGKVKTLGRFDKFVVGAQWTITSQETAKVATESLVFAYVDPLADQMKT